jgi:hypothetical protein
MKVTQNRGFNPVTIILETQDEVDRLMAIVGCVVPASSRSNPTPFFKALRPYANGRVLDDYRLEIDGQLKARYTRTR